MSAPGAYPAEPIPPRSDRAALVQAWVQALRNQASSAQLQALAPLSDAEAARVMALLRGDAHAAQPVPRPNATAAAKPPSPAPATAALTPPNVDQATFS